MIVEHDKTPHLRLLQKELAMQFTSHGVDAYELAVKTSELLFGKSTKEALASLSTDQLKKYLKEYLNLILIKIY